MQIFKLLSTFDWVDISELTSLVKEKMQQNMNSEDYEKYRNYLILYKKLDLLREYVDSKL